MIPTGLRIPGLIGIGPLTRSEGGGVVLSAPFTLSRSQRVDILLAGDSNVLQGGHGWDHGIQAAMSAAGISMWATGLVSQNENGGSGSGVGYRYNRVGPLIGAVTGAPAGLDEYLNKGSGDLFQDSYVYLGDGDTSFDFSTNNGLIVTGTCPLDTTAALEFDLHYGTFTSGSGSFRPSVRREESPFTFISTPAAINTNTGAYGMARTTLAIAADAGRAGWPLSGKWTVPGNTGVTGPFFATYMRARNPARTTGYSLSVLNARGGASTRTLALDLQEASDETLTHKFGILREDQGAGSKCFIVVLNEGLNDRNESSTSVGPAAVTTGDSPEAFVDNCTAVVERLQEIWTLNSWPQDELHFVFMPSHRINDPDDLKLISYRKAIAIYAETLDQGYVIDLGALVTSAQMVSNSWYANSVSDRNHLTQAGYEGVGALAIARRTSIYDIDAEAFFARITSSPSAADKAALNNVVVALKGTTAQTDLWARFDVLRLLAAQDAQAARLNMVADRHNLTENSSPAFTAYRGYQGNGSSSYLNSDYAPSTQARNYSLNGGSLMLWVETGSAEDKVDLSMGDSNVINAMLVGNSARGRVNRAVNTLAATVSGATGFLIAKRTGSAALQLRKNKTQIATDTATPDASLSGTAEKLLWNTGPTYSSKRLALSGIAAGLTDAEADRVYDAVHAYLVAVGAVAP